jgi:hypothetical protein
MSDVVQAIEAAAPEAAGRITFDDVQLPFPGEFEAKARPAQATPLEVGVRETIELFRSSARIRPSLREGHDDSHGFR